MYGHYISLGTNCEVAFQFRRVLQRDSSSFFSWNVTSSSSLLSLFRADFQSILSANNISQHGDGGLCLDASHGYLFHSPFACPNPLDDPRFEASLASHRQKVNYLIEKLYESAKGDERIAYFYKTDEIEAKKVFTDLRNEMLRFHNGRDNFVIVAVLPQTLAEPDWKEDGIDNCYIKRFAPVDDASDAHVSTWDKIFRKHPHLDPMYLSGY